MTKYETAYEKRVIMTWATSKGSGEPAHKRSLARAFAVRRYVVVTFGKLQAKKNVFVPIKGLPISI